MLMCKKIGMTRIYDENGKVYATTVLQIDGQVVGHNTIERNGYLANIIMYGKKSKMKKPQRYLCEKFNRTGKIKELRVTDEQKLYEIGSDLSANELKVGQKLKVTGISKGKGFAGVMKRHNFKGGNASHGSSKFHRGGGSTGQCQDPGKVFKGKKMAGHMGAEQVSHRGIKIVRIQDNIIWIHGAVPGPKNRYIKIEVSKNV